MLELVMGDQLIEWFVVFFGFGGLLVAFFNHVYTFHKIHKKLGVFSYALLLNLSSLSLVFLFFYGVGIRLDSVGYIWPTLSLALSYIFIVIFLFFPAVIKKFEVEKKWNTFCSAIWMPFSKGIDLLIRYLRSNDAKTHTNLIVKYSYHFLLFLFKFTKFVVLSILKPIGHKLFRLISDKFVHCFVAVICLQLIYPPVHVPYRHFGMVTYGHQFLFTSHGVEIDIVRLIIQVMLSGVLMYSIKLAFDKFEEFTRKSDNK